MMLGFLAQLSNTSSVDSLVDMTALDTAETFEVNEDLSNPSDALAMSWLHFVPLLARDTFSNQPDAQFTHVAITSPSHPIFLMHSQDSRGPPSLSI